MAFMAKPANPSPNPIRDLNSGGAGSSCPTKRADASNALKELARLLGAAAAREFLATKPEPSTEPDGHATLRRTETKEKHHD